MKIPPEIIASVVIGWGWDLWVSRRKTKLILELLEEREIMTGEINYMCHILNENGVELDEFDLIALPHVSRMIESEAP
jgi:hypothetical protein